MNTIQTTWELCPEKGRELALALNHRAKDNPLYTQTRAQATDGRHTSWRLAPAPYVLSPEQAAYLEALGGHLLAFTVAANRLYQDSVKGHQPGWVHRLLDAGKPQAVVDYQRMNRFRSVLPRVIRPDLIIDETGRFRACELDSVPGGIGLTASMCADYAQMGFKPLGGAHGLVEGFATMIREVANQSDPLLAIVVSDEASDYWLEQRWLGERLNELGLDTVVVRPAALHYADDGLMVSVEGDRRRVDVVYRFFELFDLKNIPKSELVQYANKKAQVVVTPPYKAFLEEKMLFALYHHPVLRAFWRANLSADTVTVLDDLLPHTWVVDPTPLPPQAVIPGLQVGGAPLTHWLQLSATNKRERTYVLKPSGFSPLAWGSHGVAFGHDLSTADWEAALKGAMNAFAETPHILQVFHKPERTRIEHYNFVQDRMISMEGRARFCPYYYVVGQDAQLAGVLTTVCPLDKLALHGMSDAVMVPAALPARPCDERPMA